MYRLLLSVACACLLTATPASAQIVFTLNSVGLNVSGTAAGSLTGTFTTNSNTLTSSSTLLTWNISAPSTGVIGGHAFAGFTYNPTDSTAVFNVGGNGLLTGFELDSPVNSTTSTAADAIRFYFTTNLSTSGLIGLNTTTATSYENEHNSAGTRTVNSGASVDAVPEPSAYALAFVALALFAGLRFRSRARA